MLQYDERVVETIKELLTDGKITEDYVRNLLDRQRITLDEFVEIVPNTKSTEDEHI